MNSIIIMLNILVISSSHKFHEKWKVVKLYLIMDIPTQWFIIYGNLSVLLSICCLSVWWVIFQTGDLPNSYQLVSIVSHIGHSSVSGRFVVILFWINVLESTYSNFLFDHLMVHFCFKYVKIWGGGRYSPFMFLCQLS